MLPLLIIYLLGALVVFIACIIIYRTNAYEEIFFFSDTTDSLDAFARTMVCMILYPAILAFILLSIPLFLFTLAINEIGHLIFKIPKKEM
jgi:hypothetical protein